MRVHVVDPSAFAPPYDHALCDALARAGVDVELITSSFTYGPVPESGTYAVRRAFYRLTPGSPGSRLRVAAKLGQHVPDMVRYRRYARRADVVHFQWLPVEPVDLALRPRGRPLVLTAHQMLPPRPRPGQAWGRRRLYERVDAVIAHTQQGRSRLMDEFGIDPRRIALIPHGAFHHLAEQPDERPLPAHLAGVEGPIVLCFGIWRPDHGIDVLLEAWRGIRGAELWLVGLPKMRMEPLIRSAPPGVRFLPGFVTDPELPAYFRRADLIALPYRSMEASGVLFTALAFGKPIVGSAVGALADLAGIGGAEVVDPGDPQALHQALARLLGDGAARARLAAGARAAADGPYSWDSIAAQTIALYERLLAGAV